MGSVEKIEFLSSGVVCAGWFFRAAQDSGNACVILGHGFSGVKEARLDAYAQKFAEAGYNVLVFDYRHFGESRGEPRQLLDIRKQQQDWHAAIAYARARPEVDSHRIALWGTSFSGGHVVEVAAADGSTAAVISQVPHMNGPATAMAAGPVQGMRLGLAALYDQLRGLAGLSPFYIPAFGRPGELAAMTASGAYEASRKLAPEGLDMDERVAARIVLRIPFFSPARHVRRLNAPWLVQVAEADQTTPPRSAIKAARKAPTAELITCPLGHFDVYVSPGFERIIGDQLDFLERHMGPVAV